MSRIRSEVLVEAVLEILDDAVFTHDAGGRVTSWNQTAERFFGFVASEVLGRPSEVLFPEHLRGEVRSVFETVQAGARVRHFETEVLRKDGMPMPISLSLCPIVDEGDVPASCSTRWPVSVE